MHISSLHDGIPFYYDVVCVIICLRPRTVLSNRCWMYLMKLVVPLLRHERAMEQNSPCHVNYNTQRPSTLLTYGNFSCQHGHLTLARERCYSEQQHRKSTFYHRPPKPHHVSHPVVPTARPTIRPAALQPATRLPRASRDRDRSLLHWITILQRRRNYRYQKHCCPWQDTCPNH